MLSKEENILKLMKGFILKKICKLMDIVMYSSLFLEKMKKKKI